MMLALYFGRKRKREKKRREEKEEDRWREKLFSISKTRGFEPRGLAGSGISILLTQGVYEYKEIQCTTETRLFLTFKSAIFYPKLFSISDL